MLEKLLQDFLSGDRRALARLITLVEDRYPGIERALSKLFPRIGRAHRVGITGPPGSGKSTLVDELAVLATDSGMKVAVIAVDPSSPFTGGALLGDRYRMSTATEKGIFIRSLASRGSLGGLSEATTQVADLFDAYGVDIIFMETIGVGQSELDIMNAADTVTVVLVPESGDAIQAMKAGLMEIADIFAINKSDRAGADRFENELRSIVNMASSSKNGWELPIIRSVAIEGKGIEEILDVIVEHRKFLEKKGVWEDRRKKRIRYEIESLIKGWLWKNFIEGRRWEEILSYYVDKVLEGKETPYTAMEKLIEEFGSDDLGKGRG